MKTTAQVEAELAASEPEALEVIKAYEALVTAMGKWQKAVFPDVEEGGTYTPEEGEQAVAVRGDGEIEITADHPYKEYPYAAASCMSGAFTDWALAKANEGFYNKPCPQTAAVVMDNALAHAWYYGVCTRNPECQADAGNVVEMCLIQQLSQDMLNTLNKEDGLGFV